MANFTALKTAINNAIKTNGNEEITGAILQAILDAMVETLGDSAITDLENAITTEVTNRENAVGDVAADLAAEALARANKDNLLDNRINAEEYNRQNADAALSQTMSQGFQTLGSQMTALNAAISALNAAYQNGYLYGGIATPSSSPSNNKCFYIALQGGTYTNFGGVGVVEGINIIKNDSGWKVEHIYDQTTLLNEFYLLRQQVIRALASYEPVVIQGDVTNAPDEEDLTSDAQHLLKFKDRAYSPLNFSGLGMKILRKNILPLNDSAAFNGFVEGVTAEETLAGTPELIFWDRMNTRFIGIKDGIYYAAWTDDDNYVPVSTSLVYMYNGIPYQWTGSDFIVDETEVPNLVNCLTQDMINEANTIYIIRYDYTLKEDITIPANCVLQFDGGSISGEHTITGANTGIQAGLVKIFSTDVILAGTWNIKEILANWFIADNNADMFQTAFDFAKLCSLETTPNAKYIIVTCISKEYIIDKTLYIGAYVSFDANGSVIKPAKPFEGQYMFSCNSVNTTTWEVEYPNNIDSYFGNFLATDTEGSGVYLLYCADSRKICNIKSKYFARLILYNGSYIDNKRIERVFNMYPTTELDYTSETTEANTVAVALSLGDNCSINQCAFSIRISNLANAHLDNFMGFVSVSNCSTVDITNAHTEAEAFLDVFGASVVNVTNFYGYVDKNRITIRTNGKDSLFPTLNLENCYFYKMSDLGADYHSYRVIRGAGLITCKNVFGCLSDSLGQNDKGQGASIGLKSPINNDVEYIDPVDDVKCGDNRYLKSYKIRGNNTFARTSAFTANTGGTDFYVRIRYHAPYFVHPFYFDQYTIGLKATDAIKCFASTMPLSVIGCIIKLEFSTDGTAFTHYFDLKIAGNRDSYIKLEKTQDGYLVDNIPAKQINDYYPARYVKIDLYENIGENVKVRLSSDVTSIPMYLPNILNKGDIIVTSEGVTLVRNASASFHAEGQTSGTSDNRPTLKPVKGIQYFDETLGKPIWWNGTAWVDATGAAV